MGSVSKMLVWLAAEGYTFLLVVLAGVEGGVMVVADGEGDGVGGRRL